MKISPFKKFGSYGVYVDNVDFDTLTIEEWMQIGRIHMTSLVTVIRNCNVDPKKISYWTDMWGPGRYRGMLTICKNYPEHTAKEVIAMALKRDNRIDPDHVQVIENRFKTRAPGGSQRVTDIRDKKGGHTGIFPDGELHWHSNEAGNPIFAPGVALLGSQNMIGSSTGFLQTADYYWDVSESFRSELDDMVVVHKWQDGKLHVKDIGEQERMMKMNMAPEGESYIPMVIQSPGGIKGLHYSLNTVDHIVGMSIEESKKLFERMNKELMTEKYMMDHWYENDNDWMFFDNSIVNHRRLGEVSERLAFRVQHGYDHIEIPNYNPYFDEVTHEQYDVRLAELRNFMAENFSD